MACMGNGVRMETESTAEMSYRHWGCVSTLSLKLANVLNASCSAVTKAMDIRQLRDPA